MGTVVMLSVIEWPIVLQMMLHAVVERVSEHVGLGMMVVVVQSMLV